MKLRYLVLTGALAQAGLVHGMGLGELELQSYLGNPLQADLTVLSPAPFDQEDIRVRIARPEIYERFGARFEPFHNQIDFALQPSREGDIRVTASSRDRMQEPYLDIVVELSWPQGTTYRRYSVLVDPPAYAARWRKPAPSGRPQEAAAIAMAQPSRPSQLSQPQSQQPEPQARPAAAPAPRQAVRARPEYEPVVRARPSQPTPDLSQPYVVQSGDSLWKIARRLQPAGGQPSAELMDRLLAANPQAFINGDPGRLRQGATLYLPAGTDTQVAQATPASPAKAAPRPDVSASVNGAAAPATGLDIQAALKSTQQASAAAVPESPEEIRAALARLEQDKAELHRFQDQVKADMVNVLEQRIAVTQALQAAEQNRRELAPASEPVADSSTSPAEALVAKLQAPAEEKPPTLSTLLAAQAGSGPRLDATTLPGMGAQPESPVATLLEPRNGLSLWYLLAMIPLGLLLVLLGMRSQRVHRLRESESLKDVELYELVFGSRRDRSRSDAPDQVRQALDQIREKAGQSDAAVSRQPVEEHHHTELGEHRDDLKQMIDLYMLYSQYQKAQNVILTEISKRPARADLRLYLMQVYAAMGDWQSFDDQLDVLRRMGNTQLLDEALKLRRGAEPEQP